MLSLSRLESRDFFVQSRLEARGARLEVRGARPEARAARRDARAVRISYNAGFFDACGLRPYVVLVQAVAVQRANDLIQWRLRFGRRKSSEKMNGKPKKAPASHDLRGNLHFGATNGQEGWVVPCALRSPPWSLHAMLNSSSIAEFVILFQRQMFFKPAYPALHEPAWNQPAWKLSN